MKRLVSVLTLVFSALFVFQLYSYERIVLIEEFTSATCPPCVRGSENMNKVVDPSNGILSIRYHMDWPAPNDPFNLHNYAENMARRTYYGVGGIPHAVVCGQTEVNPASDLKGLQQAIQHWQSRSTPLNITVAEDRSDPNNVQVTVTVKSDEALQGLTLRVAVVARFVELPDLPDQLANSNGETEFYDAMLDMLPDADGTDFNIAAGETKTFTFNYAMGSGELWPEGQIYVTAFVQNDQTKEVLQAGTDLVEYGVTLQALQRYLWVDPQDEVSTQVTVINPYSDKDLTVLLSVDENRSLLPLGWEAAVSMDTISLAAGQQQTFTLSIVAPAEAGYANVVVKVKVQVPDGVGRTETVEVGCMSNATRYLAFPLLGWGTATVTGLTGLPDYGDYVTLVPPSQVTPDFLTAYPLEDFDAVLFFTDYFSRGFLSANVFDELGVPLRNGITAAIQEGKGVWISTELDIYFAWDQQYGSSHAQNFWQNVVGVRSNGGPIMRVQTDNQGRITGVLPFTIEGQQGDSVGDGITLSYNQMTNWQQVPFVIFTENFTPVSNDVIAVFQDDEGQLMGIRREDPQSGGRIVYTGFPLHGTSDIAAVGQLMEQVMRWITAGKTAPKPPTISAPAELQFGEVAVGSSKTMTADIANVGNEPLEITGMTLYDDDQVFTILNAPSLPLTLQPGEKVTLEIQFQPKQTAEYVSMLIIESNDPRNNPYSIVLSGRGAGATGVAIEQEPKALQVRVIPDDRVEFRWEGVPIVNAEIRDIRGRLVHQFGSVSASVWRWDIRDVPSGTYFVRIETARKSVVIPFQIVH